MEVNLIEECDLDDAKSKLKPTVNGHLMARYCLAFETMKSILIELGYSREKDATDSQDDYLNEVNSNQIGQVSQNTKMVDELVRLI